MAKKLRVAFPDTIYHITHCVNGKRRIFTNYHDRERFLLHKLFEVLAEEKASKRAFENISDKLDNEHRK
jgi:hypothetical protein